MKTNTKAKQKKSIKPQLNRMKTKLILLLLSAATICGAQQRKVTTLADGWLFSRDKLTWQQVSVPHDWAINGPFDKKWDLQTVAIEQDRGHREIWPFGRPAVDRQRPLQNHYYPA